MAKVNQTTLDNSVTEDELISDDLRVVLLTVNFCYICQFIDIVGTATNVVNIICFIKQGFRDTVNISLFALSLADLVCLLILLWNNILLNPLIYTLPNFPLDQYEIVVITAVWPHVVFARISACITAFISTERCLCVAFPLNVKTMITRKRVTVIMACIYVINLASVSPIYYCNRFSWKFYLKNNRTVLQTDSTSDRQIIENITFAITNVSIPCLTFLVVIVTTIVLVIKIHGKSRWRKGLASSKQSEAMFIRDRILSKMVIVISSVFVVCYGPVCIIFVAMIVEKELSIYGQYKNIFGVVLSIAYIMESISMSTNFIIYYKMSSRYRTVIRNMFCLGVRCVSDRRKVKIKIVTVWSKEGEVCSKSEALKPVDWVFG